MGGVGWVVDFMAEIIAKAGERSKEFQNTVRKGWAASADGTTQVSKGATDPDGIYHVNGKDGGRVGNTSGSNSKPGVIRGALAKPSANYTFDGPQLVFDGFCPSVQIRQDTGKTVTFGNVRVVSGVNGEFRNGRGNITPIVDCLFTNCWCGGGNGPVGAVIRDAGVTESWMTGALDLYRQPRIDNPKHSVDIGAAECQKTEGMVLIMR